MGVKVCTCIDRYGSRSRSRHWSSCVGYWVGYLSSISAFVDCLLLSGTVSRPPTVTVHPCSQATMLATHLASSVKKEYAIV